MADDLLTPTVAAEAYEVRRTPWRPQSLLYPAVFGGPTAVTVLGLVNGARLGVSRRATMAVAGAGVAALAARIAVTLWLSAAGTERPSRVIGAVAGALAWLAVAAVQKPRFRAYELRGGEPASLWGPGLAAVLVCGFAEAALILAVTS
ncbi:hypothetical protein [Micromonospora thermarum]|uniref:Uncharacterized protein n=1 Tax=Micromonospora thermarum TaxID=2720024 RepID=A0ABX0Z3B5_9ACTN|nr:hypothetical protein [Micromonospora thermarum]NJP31963.1 hypothetical protein [Micromonospora thermarum]